MDGDTGGLDSYSDTCLRRVWRAEHFSWFMTSMLHNFDSGSSGAGGLDGELAEADRQATR